MKRILNKTKDFQEKLQEHFDITYKELISLDDMEKLDDIEDFFTELASS